MKSLHHNVKLVIICFTFCSTFLIAFSISAKSVKYKKTQEVNFEGADVDGQVRNPDGAYVLQKRGVDFLPLYKVRSGFDENIKESIEHLR